MTACIPNHMGVVGPDNFCDQCRPPPWEALIAEDWLRSKGEGVPDRGTLAWGEAFMRWCDEGCPGTWEDLMTPGQAAEALANAGLHVRLLDNGDILGGSHVDRSGSLNEVLNGFLVKAVGGGYTVEFGESPSGPMPLEGAVVLVLQRVTPQPDVGAPPREPTEGTVYY